MYLARGTGVAAMLCWHIQLQYGTSIKFLLHSYTNWLYQMFWENNKHNKHKTASAFCDWQKVNLCLVFLQPAIAIFQWITIEEEKNGYDRRQAPLPRHSLLSQNFHKNGSGTVSIKICISWVWINSLSVQFVAHKGK